MSDQVNRRDFMKTVATTSAVAATGCQTRGPAEAQSAPSSKASTAQTSAVAADAVDPAVAIQSVERLTFPWQTADPFLFCVHHKDDYPAGNESMGPATSLAGRNLGMDFGGKDGWSMYHGEVVPGFPQHPHRGFETITIARSGFIDHSDSLGATARFGGGDVQWMTAGKGIVHSEMFPLRARDQPNPAELFQIWINLPRSSKFVDPHFTMMWREDIPVETFKDAAGKATEVQVVAGDLGPHKAPAPPPDSWAAQANADVVIYAIKMEAGAEWVLPAGPAGVNRALYAFRGQSVSLAGRSVNIGQRVMVKPDVNLAVIAGAEPVEILMLQGRPIGEPVVQRGPFVMNTPGEIRQAYADYQRTRFGGWPWPSSDPVHAREQGRFARHANGKVEMKG